jgi:uncharacterized secreted protein with C-terminal beta-propeller domain
LAFESLEPRVVLDAQFGAALAGNLGISDAAATEAGAVSEPARSLERFTSADELQQFLIRDANQRYGDLFGREAWGWWSWLDVMIGGDPKLNPDALVEHRGDYSTTNIQVAGVDEGDLVKTDGQYLYIGVGPEVTIVDVQSAAEMRVLSRLGSEGQTSALYLSDERLTVISQSTSWFRGPMPLTDVALRYPSWGGEPKFQVTVYDVSSPETPQLISRLEIEGNYVDSRMIGQTVYLVSGHSFHLPPPEIVPVRPVVNDDEPGRALPERDPQDDLAVGILPWPGSDGIESGWAYETQEQYWQRIGDRVLDLALPNYAIRDAAGNAIAEGLLSAPDATYRPLKGQADQLVSITAFDVAATQPGILASTSAPVGWTSTVYVSPQNLYVVSADWSLSQATSEIYKFALRPEQGQIPLVATGRVPGQVLNAFSLDERGNYLRIVTQSGWREDATSALYVLEQQDERLVLSGQIEDLAPGEHLFSVRFLGDLAFVVTFGPQSGVWYDPLFTIDLSDPTSPQVIGELEIPGFSNYLQSIEGEFLIGLGRNADEANGRQLEPQVSLFDVSDLANPQLTDRLSFGSESAWSEAFFNHHAISYFPEQGILAVPLDSWFPNGLPIVRDIDRGGVVETSLPRWLSQLWVFRVDTQADPPQLHVLGTIEHDSTILRSVRIGEQLFSISGETIRVHDLYDPGVALGALYFGRPAEDDWFSVDLGSQDNLLDVLANDRIQSAGGAWTIASVTQTQSGFVTIADDGLGLRYTPAASFVGQASFVYTIAGPGGMTDEAQVTIDVNPWSVQRRMTQLARRDLAARLSVPIEEIRERSAEIVRWPDSCLGVPVPGQACLTVITPGFRIVLLHDNAAFTYHTDTRDTVILAKTADGDPVLSQPVVRVRLEATDAVGQVVTTIKAGETLTLNLYVDDLRDSGDGVYAAYADIFYPARLLSLTEDPIVFDEIYANGRSADVKRAGLLNELGAFAGLQTLGDGERLLARVSFVAQRSGTAAFVVTPAGAIGHEVLVYGENEAVPARWVDWQGVEVQVVGGWRNIASPTDVNDDGRTSALDALLGINAINTHGVLRLEQPDPEPAVAAVAEMHYYDVNGDGYLTPEDMLHVINRLNAANEHLAGGDSVPVRPLAAWVDWKSLHDLLREDRWQQPLQTLHLSPERTMRLVHEILVTVDADRLDDLVRNRVPFEPAQWKDAIGPVLDAIRSHVSVDQLLDLADQLQANFDDLDLPAILPGLAPQINLTAAGEVFHDAFFAKLSNPLFLLDLLDS